jgi:hypothetical protein
MKNHIKYLFLAASLLSFAPLQAMQEKPPPVQSKRLKKDISKKKIETDFFKALDEIESCHNPDPYGEKTLDFLEKTNEYLITNKKISDNLISRLNCVFKKMNRGKTFISAVKQDLLVIVKYLSEKVESKIPMAAVGLALWHAAEQGFLEIVKYICESERLLICFNLGPTYLSPAISRATKQGHQEIVKYLEGKLKDALSQT